ncbi:MAG: endolytic transglycosylase MltG [Oscillospiraceae bacterium]|nr:endolytic transglycosylase MltG [Oscillospiraceae bacterium]
MDNNKRPNSDETKKIPTFDELKGKIPPIVEPPDFGGDDDIEETEYEPMITRRRERSTGLIGGIMYFAFVICISLILACLLWIAANDVLSLNKDYLEATIDIPALPYSKTALIEQLKALEITASATSSVDKLLDLFPSGKKPYAPFDMDALIDQLKEKGIIEHPQLFRLYVRFAGAQDKIQPGVYEINTNLDYHAIVTALRKSSGSRPVVSDVLIPEGYTVAQIFALLEEKKVCSADLLWEAAANYAFEYDFLEGLPYGDKNRLEGFLFPDTYNFFQSSEPDEAIKKLLSNFKIKFDADLIAQTAAQGKTVKEILTVASLIEREAASDSERPIIASVIYNRLTNWDNPLLQIDASIQYALPEHKDALSYEDLTVDSPYNTYTNPGLPPGPIANPGIASIKAALNPDTTEFYFYALDKTFAHQFFKTQAEHEAFVASPEFVNN